MVSLLARETAPKLHTLTFARFLIAVQLVPDVAGTLVPPERVDALVLAAMVHVLALVHLLHEGGRKARLLHRSVRDELHEQLVGR